MQRVAIQKQLQPDLFSTVCGLLRVPGSTLLLVMAVCFAATFDQTAMADDDGERFFETAIRPILVEHCLACHGAGERNGGLRLDSKAALLKGGDSGPAAVAGQVESLLLKAVNRTDGLEMPPEEPLSDAQVAALRKWVEIGMPWPAADARLLSSAESRAKEHWAFQPVADPRVPDVPKEFAAANSGPTARSWTSSVAMERRPSADSVRPSLERTWRTTAVDDIASAPPTTIAASSSRPTR